MVSGDVVPATAGIVQEAIHNYLLRLHRPSLRRALPVPTRIELPRDAKSGHQWQWPPVIGVADGGLWSTYRASRLEFARRRLVRLVPVFECSEPVDYLIVGSGTEQDIISHYVSAGEVGMVLVVGQRLGPIAADLDNEAFARALLKRRIMFGAVPIRRADARQWLDGFIRELSHDATPDVALTFDLVTPRTSPFELGDPEALLLRPVVVAERSEELQRSTVSHQARVLARHLMSLSFDVLLNVPDKMPWPAIMPKVNVPARAVGIAFGDMLDNFISYARESDGASIVAALRSELDNALSRRSSRAEQYALRRAQSDDPIPPESTSPRFTDVLLYELEYSGQRRLLGDEALIVGNSYDIEVSVREHPIGVQALEERRPLPRTDWSSEVDVLVAITTPDADVIEIKNNCAFLQVPPTGDSINVVAFTIYIRSRPQEVQGRGSIEVRLYHNNRLLDFVVLRPVVLGKGQHLTDSDQIESSPLLGLLPGESQLYAGFDKIGAFLERNALSVHVMNDGSSYRLEFLVDTADKESGDSARPLALSTSVKLTPEDLKVILAKARDYWWRLIFETAYGEKYDPDERQRASAIAELELLGGDLFRKLFPRRGANKDANAVIAWLFSQAKPGATIEVVFHSGSESFVFPWSLLCLDAGAWGGEVECKEEGLPIGERLLGLRFVIEQKPHEWTRDFWRRRHRPNRRAIMQRSMSAAVWSSFHNTKEHLDGLKAVTSLHGGEILWASELVEGREELLNLLEKRPPEVLYIYGHGYTRSCAEDILFDMAREYLRQGKGAKVGSENVASRFRESLELIVKGYREDDFIKLTKNRITYSELDRIRFELPLGSIVFLNMCESAQLYPARSESFVALFLESGADAVIGTDCPMACAFADPFARAVFSELIEGCTLGEALRRARSSLFEKSGNPLGLAYTVYGSTAWRLSGETPVSAYRRSGYDDTTESEN